MTLPITKNQAYSAAHWIKSNFGSSIDHAIQGTPFTTDLLCGIACQETAYFWLSFIDSQPADIVLARCVLDASGDYPGTVRTAFPNNTDAFRTRYLDEKTNLLIAEANATREMRGFEPKQWVYKGYGLFQYDLQYVTSDEPFFFEKQWYSFDACLSRAVRELRAKYERTNDIWAALKAYNGSGSSATKYANNVVQYTKYCSEISAG